MRSEWYNKTSFNIDYTLDTIEVVIYPKDNEIEAIIRDTFQ
jgi:hypothetical protein